MRIAFLGVPEMGFYCLNALIQAGKNIVGVVPPPPSHVAHNMMINLAKQHNIPCVFFEKSPKEEDFIAGFKELKPDIGLVCSFDHRLPAEIINEPPLGIINCHPSLLPEYRGGNPYSHVIINDEKKTGITLHYMDEGFDTGDIVTQWETPVAPDETMGTLFNRLNQQTITMILEIINKIEKGEKIPGTPQPREGNFKNAPLLIPDRGDTIIDWRRDARYIERFVRALNPYFGGVSFFRRCQVRIWYGNSATDMRCGNPVPGTITKVSKDNLSIATGKGIFFPTVIQIGSHLILDVKDFIRRTNPRAGELFTSM
jgi:methionyl-tRNA formyltransferase